MTSIFHSDLSKDLSLILNDADDFNVIIQVGENQNIKEFRAHSVILRARSPYFKSAFKTEWITKNDNMIMFNKPNIAPNIFGMILRYIYTGEVDLTNQSADDVLKLLVASDELLIEELFEHVQDYLIEKQPTWIHQDFSFILHSVFNLAHCKKLQDYCLESICADPQFIASKSFLALDKGILYALLKRDDLQIEEVIIWDCLIKWGIEQTPGLENKNGDDKEKWNNKDYEALKKTLYRFIPLIRFVEFASTDYFDQVHPYKAIIPNHIYEEVEEFYYKGILPKLPPRTGKIISKIINPKFSRIITNWINGKNENVTRKIKPQLSDYCNIIVNWIYKKKSMPIRIEKNSLKFNLIYRGSRDGIDSKSFRSKCKGQVASLVLIKVQQSDKIFGGYSSIGFSSIENDCLRISSDYGWRWYHSSDNFIFSFKNSEDAQNMKISRVISNSKAILDHNDHGFNFGQGSLCMNDQILHVNNCCGNYEKKLNTNIVYTIEEIETFIVVKK